MALIIFHENRIFSTRAAKKIVFCLVLVFVFDFFLFPAPVLAANTESENYAILNEEMDQENIIPENMKINNQLPINNDLIVEWSGTYAVTAYNSEKAQCDDSPCITANGFNVCEHGIEDTIAANFLEFGAKVRIPDLFGDRIFIVRDRMNKRFNDRVDIWMKDRQDAIDFGIKYTKIEVLEP